jgi:hypothetical protein
MVKILNRARHQWLTAVIPPTGGRDQEDCSLKPAWVNISQDPISKKPIIKGLAELLKVKALSSSPSTTKKKNPKNKKNLNLIKLLVFWGKVYF